MPTTSMSNNLIDEGQFGAPIILTAFNYAHGLQEGVEFTGSYDRGPWSVYGNLGVVTRGGQEHHLARSSISQPDELAYHRQQLHPSGPRSDMDRLRPASPTR